MKEVSLFTEDDILKQFEKYKNARYVKSKEFADKIACSVFIQVDRAKEEESVLIKKVNDSFREVLKLALKSETLKTILNNDELRIVLIDSQSTYAGFCSGPEDMKLHNYPTIFIEGSFDNLKLDKPFLEYSQDSDFMEIVLNLMFEASNFSNIALAIPNLLMPLVNDKDLYGLITEFAEYRSVFTANKIANEVIKNEIPDFKGNYRGWVQNFAKSWAFQNEESDTKPAHTESYRLTFSNLKTNSLEKWPKELTKKDLQKLNAKLQVNQELFELVKKFVTNFPSTVEKMYQQKVPNLPDRKVFDEFVLKLTELINADKVLVENEDHESETKISGENTSQEVKETKLPEYDLFLAEDKEQDIELLGDDLFTQVSEKVHYDPCTLF